MNPFSGFLQPQNNRPLQGLATTQDLLRVNQGQKEMAQRKLENEQQNARGNAYLALQQGDQAHRWGAEEQKQVEGLLAEYQEAEDQGDPVRLARAEQMLKRFGMDVSKKAAPDLKALTGESLLPGVARKPAPGELQALTGQPPNPIDQAIETELKSRQGMSGRMGAAEPELSPEEFEQQLIDGSGKLPERMESSNGGTTPAMHAMLQQAPEEEPVDMGDVDSPEFKQAASQEGTNGSVMDLDAEDPTPLQVGEPAQAAQQAPAQQPRRLSTQLLPTVVSKKGKQLYESTGPSGRWAPMVAGVFEPYMGHENPQIAAAAKSASQLAQKLIQVDDIPPKEAIKIASEQMMKDAGLTVGLERTKLGSKPKGGGGGMVGGVAPKAMGAIKDDMYSTLRLPQFATKGIQDGLLGYDSAINAISSANSASQYDSINQMIQARSGKVVSDRERAIYNNLAGAWNGWMKQFNLLGGGQLPEGYREKLKQMMSEARVVLIQERDRRAAAGKEFHNRVLQGRGLRPEDIEADSEAVASAIRRGDVAGAGDPNADLDQ